MNYGIINSLILAFFVWGLVSFFESAKIIIGHYSSILLLCGMYMFFNLGKTRGGFTKDQLLIWCADLKNITRERWIPQELIVPWPWFIARYM